MVKFLSDLDELRQEIFSEIGIPQELMGNETTESDTIKRARLLDELEILKYKTLKYYQLQTTNQLP